MPVRRNVLLALAVSCSGASFAACGGSSGASGAHTSTTVASGPACSADARVVAAKSRSARIARLTTATLRARYQALASPANKIFATFSTKLASLSSATTSADMKTAVFPAATAITAAANGFWCLHFAAPPTLATRFRSVAVADDVVQQALLILAANYGKRSFDLRGWGASFRTVVDTANAAETSLRRGLGLH